MDRSHKGVGNLDNIKIKIQSEDTLILGKQNQVKLHYYPSVSFTILKYFVESRLGVKFAY